MKIFLFYFSGASSERGSSRGISSRNGKEFANNNNSKPVSWTNNPYINVTGSVCVSEPKYIANR